MGITVETPRAARKSQQPLKREKEIERERENSEEELWWALEEHTRDFDRPTTVFLS